MKTKTKEQRDLEEELCRILKEQNQDEKKIESLVERLRTLEQERVE